MHHHHNRGPAPVTRNLSSQQYVPSPAVWIVAFACSCQHSRDLGSVAQAQAIGNAIVISLYYGMVARIIQQKGIVSVGCVDFGIGHWHVVAQQRLDNFVGTLGREPPVGTESYQQEMCPYMFERASQIAVVPS